ncbi:MAG: hypothetical protein H0W61_08465 [Bacteroidetes bacterium]|nr:hypothetical protein [Bacteroidota bacterium]
MTPGSENIRTLVSTHLTKVLMLFGRMDSDYNPRYLPVTVSSVLVLLNELEMMGQKFEDLAGLLKENIERREKFSNVFLVPPTLLTQPDLQGLRLAMCELAQPLIKSYCEEEINFLKTLDEQVSTKTRNSLFSRARRSCGLLKGCASKEDLIDLCALQDLCERELAA